MYTDRVADQPPKPPRMVSQDLPKLLGKLREAGVTEAHFHENGALKAVAFRDAVAPVGTQPEKQHGTEGALRPQVDAARAAFDVLSGRRESMDDEKKN